MPLWLIGIWHWVVDNAATLVLFLGTLLTVWVSRRSSRETLREAVLQREHAAEQARLQREDDTVRARAQLLFDARLSAFRAYLTAADAVHAVALKAVEEKTDRGRVDHEAAREARHGRLEQMLDASREIGLLSPDLREQCDKFAFSLNAGVLNVIDNDGSNSLPATLVLDLITESMTEEFNDVLTGGTAKGRGTEVLTKHYVARAAAELNLS